MNLLKFKYEDVRPHEWRIKEISLKEINLLAGISGVGKTRILRTINQLSQIIQKKLPLLQGRWNLSFKIHKNQYEYFLEIKREKDKRNFISKEILNINNDKIIDRKGSKIIFKNEETPNLGDEDVGIYLLRNNEEIKIVYENFQKIFMRPLNPDYYVSLSQHLGGISKELLLKKPKEISLKSILEEYPNLNMQIFLLKEFHEKIFKQIESDFKDIFPFVTKFNIKSVTDLDEIKFTKLPIGTYIPILVITEKNIKKDISLLNLSSGMIRALVQLIDIYTLYDDSIYLIDEFENSMGIRSLPVMLDIIKERSKKIQFILTSHHPYLLNNLNIKYWQILIRKGNLVEIINGDKLEKQFSKSYQDGFTQLINSKYIEDGI